MVSNCTLEDVRNVGQRLGSQRVGIAPLLRSLSQSRESACFQDCSKISNMRELIRNSLSLIWSGLKINRHTECHNFLQMNLNSVFEFQLTLVLCETACNARRITNAPGTDSDFGRER